jgi:Mce-associated membrane protein
MPPRWLIPALAAATVLLLGVTLWFGVLVHNRSSMNDHRDGALQAARQVAADFSTYDYRTADAQFRRLLSVSTGSMREQVQKSLTAVVPLLTQGKATAKGEVRDAAIVQAGNKEVSVIAVVDETVTNTAIPRGAIRRYRFLIVMNQVKGKWLVSDLKQA